MKRTWNLVSIIQIIQTITKNYCLCLYLSTGQVGDSMSCGSKGILKMHSVSCSNTLYDITDLVNHGMVKNTKTWISWEQNITFIRNKTNMNLCLRWQISRSYRYLAEVMFNWNYYICCSKNEVQNSLNSDRYKSLHIFSF